MLAESRLNHRQKEDEQPSGNVQKQQHIGDTAYDDVVVVVPVVQEGRLQLHDFEVDAAAVVVHGENPRLQIPTK